MSGDSKMHPEIGQTKNLLVSKKYRNEDETSSKKKLKKKKRKRKRSVSSNSSNSDSSSNSYQHRTKHTKKKHKHKISVFSRCSDSESHSSTDTKKKRKKKTKCRESVSSSSCEASSSVHKKKKHKKKNKEVKNKKKESDDLPIVGPEIPEELLQKSKTMAPMTKEEWEKQQSVVKRVYDPETGRHRLIKGTGEVLEEIVSKDMHKEINKQATLGDGNYFQAKLSNQRF